MKAIVAHLNGQAVLEGDADARVVAGRAVGDHDFPRVQPLLSCQKHAWAARQLTPEPYC